MEGVTINAHPFRYPTQTRSRRHGPRGYKKFQAYRPWLEDEFQFRCVYCLKRQQWSPTDVWSVDHVVPQDEAPERECDYSNLVLSCQWCNSRKLAYTVPDPVAVAYGNHLQINDITGEITPVGEEGMTLVKVLKLNHPKQVQMRRERIRTMNKLHTCDPNLWKELMGFPKNLPNLRSANPPGGNSRPQGLDECWYERRENLPEVYE